MGVDVQNAAETIVRNEHEASPGNRPQSPLYQHIYLTIRNNILNGKYPDGSYLPSEHEVSKIFDVSRITAKRALNEIAAEGLCVRRRGQGSRVTYQPSASPLRVDVQGLFDYFSSANPHATGLVAECEYEPATEEIARRFRIDAGTEVQRSVRIRYLDGTPFSFLTTYVPAELGRKFDERDLASKAVLTLLEDTGVIVGTADQTITATLATAEAADALGVKPASPLLRVSRIVEDANDRVIEYIVGLYRPDQYQYRSLLTRISNGDERTWSVMD